MKTKIIIISSALLIFLTSAAVIDYELKNSTAEADQSEGMFIFYKSKPVKEYQYLGTYTMKFVWEEKPKLLFPKIVKKVKEKYPSAQGVIINEDMDKADAILFK